MTRFYDVSDIRFDVEASTDTRRPVVVAVGDAASWKATGHCMPLEGAIAFADISDITTEYLSLTTPRLIVSPLFARNFDCLDLAVLLSELGFPGRYRVIDDNVPNPGMVTREVAALAPGLDFSVLPPSVLTG